MERWSGKKITSLHQSNTPILHYSNTPSFLRLSRGSAASTTSATEMFFMHGLCPTSQHLGGQQGCSARGLWMAMCSAPGGFHSTGLEKPNIATLGVPTAAARCSGALSIPMNRSARSIKAANSFKFSFPATDTDGCRIAAAMRCTRSASGGAPAKMMRAPCRDANPSANSTNRSSCHVLRVWGLPG